MDISSIRESLHHKLAEGFEVYERRPGNYQLVIRFFTKTETWWTSICKVMNMFAFATLV